MLFEIQIPATKNLTVFIKMVVLNKSRTSTLRKLYI